jgi:hypothetical protein
MESSQGFRFLPTMNSRTRVSALLAFALLGVAIFSMLPLSAAHAQSPITLTVSSGLVSSQAAEGYYMVLYQNGQVIGTGFTPATFSLVAGENYTIQADNYGNCTFQYWVHNKGPDTNPLVFTAAGNNPAGSSSMLLDAVYLCGSSTGGTSQLTVTSQNTNGSPLTGFYTALYQSGDQVATGFTTATYTLNDGQAYTIQADSYGSCIFQDWAGGNTSASMPISITSNTQITAIYDCGGAPSSSLTISSVDQDGNTMAGYYTALWTSGSVIATGFTTSVFSTTSGQSYSIQVDSYGSCTFSHWSDGVTTNPRPFTASSSPESFTAVYTCS